MEDGFGKHNNVECSSVLLLLFLLLLFFLFLFISGAGRGVTSSLVLVIRRLGLPGLLAWPLSEPLGKLGYNYSVSIFFTTGNKV